MLKTTQTKELFKPLFYRLLRRSLDMAVKFQNLHQIRNNLESIVPDVANQHTSYSIVSPYQITKVRSQHAFQIFLASYAIKQIEKDSITIVDIGDSAGTHIQYLNGLFPSLLNTYSVNTDPAAIEKIKNKGLRAINTRAEDLLEHPQFDHLSIDVFLLFETLEHLLDPISFLASIRETDNQYFVLTVPYVKKSRVGFSQIRNSHDSRMMTPENTHIFELSPSDWSVIFKFTGWEIVHERIYKQYPWWGKFLLLDKLWRKFDFEGFYGVVLKSSGEDNYHFKKWNS